MASNASVMSDPGAYVFLWHPSHAIEFDSFRNLRASLLASGIGPYLRGLLGGEGNQKHDGQGHAMLCLHGYPGITQRFYGKTTDPPDSPSRTESRWSDLIRTARTTPGDLANLVEHVSPAKYQTRAELPTSPGEMQGHVQVWFRSLSAAEAHAAASWINGSNVPAAADPVRGQAWGFSRGCTNWVHGALRAAGVIAGEWDGYMTAYVHDALWSTPSPVDLLAGPEPWIFQRTGPYVHPVHFLTPGTFGSLLWYRGFQLVHVHS